MEAVGPNAFKISNSFDIFRTEINLLEILLKFGAHCSGAGKDHKKFHDLRVGKLIPESKCNNLENIQQIFLLQLLQPLVGVKSLLQCMNKPLLENRFRTSWQIEFFAELSMDHICVQATIKVSQYLDINLWKTVYKGQDIEHSLFLDRFDCVNESIINKIGQTLPVFGCEEARIFP